MSCPQPSMSRSLFRSSLVGMLGCAPFRVTHILAAAAANLIACAVERPSSTPTAYAAVKQSPAPAQRRAHRHAQHHSCSMSFHLDDKAFVYRWQYGLAAAHWRVIKLMRFITQSGGKLSGRAQRTFQAKILDALKSAPPSLQLLITVDPISSTHPWGSSQPSIPVVSTTCCTGSAACLTTPCSPSAT